MTTKNIELNNEMAVAAHCVIQQYIDGYRDHFMRLLSETKAQANKLFADTRIKPISNETDIICEVSFDGAGWAQLSMDSTLNDQDKIEDLLKEAGVDAYIENINNWSFHIVLN